MRHSVCGKILKGACVFLFQRHQHEPEQKSTLLLQTDDLNKTWYKKRSSGVNQLSRSEMSAVPQARGPGRGVMFDDLTVVLHLNT